MKYLVLIKSLSKTDEDF